jgi:hypothetical protein
MPTEPERTSLIISYRGNFNYELFGVATLRARHRALLNFISVSPYPILKLGQTMRQGSWQKLLSFRGVESGAKPSQ